MAQRKPSFRVGAVTIVCSDLKRSEHFYEHVLGAVRDPRDGYGCPWFNLGGISITLMPNAAAGRPAADVGQPMAMLWLETDDLAAAADRFARHKVSVVQPSDGMFMIVADPDGIPIEIWQAESEDQN